MTEIEYNELLKDILQKYNRKKPDIPARIMESSIDGIVKTYGESYKLLFKELHSKMYEDFGVLANPSYQSQLGVLNMIESRMKELDAEVFKEVQRELENSYASAGVFHALATESVKTLEELKGAVPYTQLNHFKMEQLVQDTMDDLLFVTQHTSKELKKVVRDAFSKNLHYHALNNENQKSIKKIIEKQLSKDILKESLEKKGFVGIVDNAGRKWNIRIYVNMAVSTKISQAYCEGLKDRAISTGKDLAVIPDKGAIDQCSKFEGMIISMTGITAGFPTYDQLRATGLIFHPNCVHTPFPVGSFDLLHGEDIATHNEKVNDLKKITK